MKIKSYLTVFLITTASLFAAQKAPLKIYLPREITVENDTPSIGQIGILRGTDKQVAAANDIVIGRFSTPDQELVVDKNVILSRLACSGIDTSKVILTGAEETVIKRQHGIITAEQFVEKATEFLRQNPPDPSICRFDVVRSGSDVILPAAGENIKMVCRLVPHEVRNQCKVQVAVLQNDHQLAQQEVTFALRYRARKIITKTAIAKGQIITAENVTLENSVSNFPEPADWTPPYGQVALRPIPAKTIVTANMTAPPQPEVILKRNQTVTIRIESAGFIATAIGKVLQDGATGEYIKVQNIDSRIILTAKVSQDGTVEPVFK